MNSIEKMMKAAYPNWNILTDEQKEIVNNIAMQIPISGEEVAVIFRGRGNCDEQDTIDYIYRRYGFLVNKLGQKKSAEAQAVIVKLPCKVGDTVYFLWRCSDETTIVHPATVKEICMGTYMMRKSIKYKIEPKGNCGMIKLFYSSDWGYNIFASKEAAEQALEKMKEV